MNCFECAKRNETTAAVAICQGCGGALCFEHLVESTHALVGGTHEGCRHQTSPSTGREWANGAAVVA